MISTWSQYLLGARDTELSEEVIFALKSSARSESKRCQFRGPRVHKMLGEALEGATVSVFNKDSSTLTGHESPEYRGGQNHQINMPL